MSKKPFCRKCLFSDFTEEEVRAKLQAYRAAMSEEEKTPEEVYTARLAACEHCPNLSNGLCRLCGCFVMLRAAKQTSICPAVHPRWES